MGVVSLCAWPRLAHAAGMSSETFSRVSLLLAAVGVGYLVTHLVIERLAQRFGFLGGVEYVALGVVLGPVLGLVGPDLTRDLRPVLLLGAGALGLGLGLSPDPAPEPPAPAPHCPKSATRASLPS